MRAARIASTCARVRHANPDLPAPDQHPLTRGGHICVVAQGFIKFALQHGYSVHPVYTFGEERTYWAFTPLRSLRLALNRLRLPAVLFLGAPRLAALPFLPDPAARLLTVVGPPLRLPRIDAPSPADVSLWHSKYCDALLRLFDDHKQQAGCPDAQLELL